MDYEHNDLPNDSKSSSHYSRNLMEFLSETEPYMAKLDALSFETATDLYDLLDDAAKVATTHIKEIDPELRVKICSKQDSVLERIIDVLPPFEQIDEQVKIFSPSLFEFKSWSNFQLMKDCGIAGYLLAKEIKAKPVMFFGTEGEEYPYLSILPGLELIYRNADEHPAVAYRTHLESFYNEMDILILYGLYTQSPGYLEAYRRVRPDGKVYCAIDMNTYWMKNIDWDSQEVQQFQHQCDVIATSCRLMRDILNRTTNVYFPCRWLPNGFYNPTGIKIKADPDYKENIILTVGRIGSPEKNNEELMVAFAKAADALPNWTLKIIGPVEDRLQPFLDWFFTTHPEMKDRVILTGAVVDKAKLYDEYAKAKIFVLSSRSESGTPNVYAEALVHGCMFISSDIDGADDITNYGELGIKYKRDSIQSLSYAMIKMCSGADKHAFQKHIPKALAYANKYYDWNRNAKKIAFMLFK